jgi:hypothetical protein
VVFLRVMMGGRRDDHREATGCNACGARTLSTISLAGPALPGDLRSALAGVLLVGQLAEELVALRGRPHPPVRRRGRRGSGALQVLAQVTQLVVGPLLELFPGR